MASYSVPFARSAREELRRVPTKDRERITDRIGALAGDPRPHGCEKLSTQDKYRIRQGDCRIVYTIDDVEVTVWVVRIGHRRDVYRRK